LITTPNCGLSSARNTGLKAATGEIVAYIDDDAYPDPQWLRYIVGTLQNSTHVAAGGPNIPPPGAGLVATSVSHSPGGPLHILLTDQIAEHIPGCNMAFWKKRLEAIGGFDPQFRVAGDDVDVCWRLQEQGWTIGYSPAAVVWHHRRGSVQTYVKQQLGYGKAEALLERKWPEKYNAAGHVQWSGRIYGLGRSGLLARQRIYYGFGGFAPFQLLYETPTLVSGSLSALPEWWFLILAATLVGSLGFLWSPLLWLWPALALAVGGMFSQAFLNACRSSRTLHFREPADRLLFVGLTSAFHVLQPLARLVGRVRYGLTAWRYPGLGSAIVPRAEHRSIWSETWCSHADYLYRIEELIRAFRCVVVRGGNYDRWDLEVKGGLLGATRSLLLVEEHGHGRQFIKIKTWPTVGLLGVIPSLVFALLAIFALLDHAPWVSGIFGFVALVLIGRTARECSSSQAVFQNVYAQLEKSLQQSPQDTDREDNEVLDTQRYLDFRPQPACVAPAPRTVAP
jgi:glycosyltransferase involved in cell wall biosynthesis